MVRRSLAALVGLSATALCAQNDTLFPNVSGVWDITAVTWDWDGQNMNFEYWPHRLRFSAEPSVVEFGLTWGTVQDEEGPVGLLAVDGDLVHYRATGVYDAGGGGGSYADTTPRLLYDLDLSIGDTAYMQDQFSAPPGWPAQVLSIDTVYLGGIQRRRFMLSNGDVWVQGVGSMEGLLRPFMDIFENGFILDAFCGEYVDADEVPYTACLPLALDVPDVPSSGMVLYPVPAKGMVTVRGGRSGAGFRLRDLRGAVVETGLLGGDPSTIPLSGISSGVYVMEVGGQRSKLVVE